MNDLKKFEKINIEAFIKAILKSIHIFKHASVDIKM